MKPDSPHFYFFLLHLYPTLNTNKVTYDQQDYQQIYLAMGENIEVLEPKELRDKIADRLQNAVNRYK